MSKPCLLPRRAKEKEPEKPFMGSAIVQRSKSRPHWNVDEAKLVFNWAQSLLGWVTAYKRVNHTYDWLELLLARTNKQTNKQTKQTNKQTLRRYTEYWGSSRRSLRSLRSNQTRKRDTMAAENCLWYENHKTTTTMNSDEIFVPFLLLKKQ
jgi:hypothetical protein